MNTNNYKIELREVTSDELLDVAGGSKVVTPARSGLEKFFRDTTSGIINRIDGGDAGGGLVHEPTHAK